jgi:hypothetical protein
MRLLGRWLLVCIAGVACSRGVWLLWELLGYEATALHHGGDGAIYTAVGRGILQGLIPYIDLFETKPPGMFLLTALSLAFTGSIHLANILQASVEAGMVAALFFSAWYLTSSLQRFDRFLLVLCALAWAMVMMFYAAARAGHMQTESFGSFFLVLYAMMLLCPRERWLWVSGAGALMMVAIGLKEPFALVALACAFILMPERRLWWGAGVPLVLVLLIGTVILAFLGYLGPYVGVYLPEMAGGRLQSFGEPLWLLALFPQKVLGDLWNFSPLFLLSIVALFASSLMMSVASWDTKKKWIGSLFLLCTYPLLLLCLHALLRVGIAWHVPFAVLFVGTVVMMAMAFSGAGMLLKRVIPGWQWADMCMFGSHILAIILATAAAGTGGFLSQQLVFAVPLYAALLLNVLRRSRDHWHFSAVRWLSTVPLFLGVLALILLPPVVIARDRTMLRVRNDRAQRQAIMIDALLTSCDWDRYLILGEPHVPYEYTEHLPYGPGFTRVGFAFPVDWRPPPVRHLQDEFLRSIERTPFIIARRLEGEGQEILLNGEFLPGAVVAYLERNFSMLPPPCAAHGTPPEEQLFLYRRTPRLRLD